MIITFTPEFIESMILGIKIIVSLAIGCSAGWLSVWIPAKIKNQKIRKEYSNKGA